MTKTQIIAKLKKDFPTLSKSFDGVDLPMSADEYESHIILLADLELEKIAADEAQKLKEEAKSVLLERLGITTDEAALLLS